MQRRQIGFTYQLFIPLGAAQDVRAGEVLEQGPGRGEAQGGAGEGEAQCRAAQAGRGQEEEGGKGERSKGVAGKIYFIHRNITYLFYLKRSREINIVNDIWLLLRKMWFAQAQHGIARRGGGRFPRIYEYFVECYPKVIGLPLLGN